MHPSGNTRLVSANAVDQMCLQHVLCELLFLSVKPTWAELTLLLQLREVWLFKNKKNQRGG